MSTAEPSPYRFPPEIIEHYRQVHEENRLRSGAGLVEFLRTQEVLRRHLPQPPAAVVDVGGATGVHAAWLLDGGYGVDLVDIVDEHLTKARADLAAAGIRVHLADARRLPFADNTFDAALLLGPLYHLTDPGDRVAALREAGRVVRHGGIVAAAAVNRYASLFDGLTHGVLADPAFRSMVTADITTGQHRNRTALPQWWTTAYFHRPEELRDEVVASGLDIVELVGLEGLAGFLPDVAGQLATDGGREAVAWAARTVESEPSLLGLSPHLLAVARVAA